jgi:hypothetical protein
MARDKTQEVKTMVGDKVNFWPAGVVEHDESGNRMPVILAIQSTSLPAEVVAEGDGTVTVSVTDITGRGHFRSGVPVNPLEPTDGCYCTT